MSDAVALEGTFAAVVMFITGMSVERARWHQHAVIFSNLSTKIHRHRDSDSQCQWFIREGLAGLPLDSSLLHSDSSRFR